MRAKWQYTAGRGTLIVSVASVSIPCAARLLSTLQMPTCVRVQLEDERALLVSPATVFPRYPPLHLLPLSAPLKSETMAPRNGNRWDK